MQKEVADSYCYPAQISRPVYQLIIRNRSNRRREVNSRIASQRLLIPRSQ